MSDDHPKELGAAHSETDQRTRDETVNLTLLSDAQIQTLSDADAASTESIAQATASRSAHSEGDRLDRYELVKPLGQGAFAEVWLAVEDGEHGFRKRVALKILKRDVTDDETYEALLHEARVCGHLHHSNVVDVYGVGQAGTATYIAMEYIEGIPLDIILRKARRARLKVPRSVIVDLGCQVAAALDHAHRAVDHVGNPLRLVHRDLKPSNIIVSSDGVAKVTDFGLAKTTTSTQETEAGTLRGTPSYVAPEVWMGTRDFSPAVDLFALGAILWEMAVGELLFKGELPTIIGAAVNGEVDYDLQMLRLHQPELSPVMGGLLQRKPEDRTQTAREVQDVLQELGAKSPGPGGLRLFMGLAEALLDENLTLDDAVSQRALSGDRDWQRFAERVAVGADGGGGAVSVPPLESSIREEPGPTLRQQTLGAVATAGAEQTGTEELGSTRTPVVSRAPKERRLRKRKVTGAGTAKRRARGVESMLLLAALAVVVATVLLIVEPWSGPDATGLPEAPSEPVPSQAEPTIDAASGKETTLPAQSPPPLLQLDEDTRQKMEARRAASKKQREASQRADEERAAAERARAAAAEERRRAAADLQARSGGPSEDLAATSPKVEAAPVAQMGCIRIDSRGGLETWIGSTHLGRFNKGRVHRIKPGTYHVRQGIQSDFSDAVGVEGVRVKAGEMTSVLCEYGKRCKTTASVGACE